MQTFEKLEVNFDKTCPPCGACCMDMRLPLSATEATKLFDAGTELITILPAISTIAEADEYISAGETLPSWSDEDGIKLILNQVRTSTSAQEKKVWEDTLINVPLLKPGEGMYEMIGRCGLLTESNQCVDYDDRPRICRDYKAGGDACKDLRQNRDIAVPVEITQKSI